MVPVGCVWRNALLLASPTGQIIHCRSRAGQRQSPHQFSTTGGSAQPNRATFGICSSALRLSASTIMRGGNQWHNGPRERHGRLSALLDGRAGWP